MAKLYEDMLLEMKDASGQNGEFYTPRPVIRFIVNMVKPSFKKGEKMLDPACGTGGFLAESLEFMRKQAKSTADKKRLFEKTLYGIEKKPLPYILGMMNLILHEIDDPNITRRNTLSKPIPEITKDDQFDVIMTNPPFGGEEESEIAKKFTTGITNIRYCTRIFNLHHGITKEKWKMWNHSTKWTTLCKWNRRKN